MRNPLLDIDFLNELHNWRQREVYARITLLNKNELPIECIEGRVTAGTVNVDGNSALRRTCNITMTLKDQSEINSFYWTFKSKFKLEVGLKNMINPKYPEIIWFPQGIFVLTTCNMNQTTNNYTITISGKDKMCKVNGDLGGVITASTDFGVLEEIDADGIITYKKLLLKDIIRELLLNYCEEIDSNIIINDLDEAGLELLEYRCETQPLYLFRQVDSGIVENITLNDKMPVRIIGESENITIGELPSYREMSGLMLDGEDAVKIYQVDENDDPIEDQKYQIMKYKYGDVAGYRLTDLVYAGELKANVGETAMSILDKIKKMLSDFEYFYNLDGRFVFQKKKTYISTPWGGSEKSEDAYVLDLVQDDVPLINLTDAKLTTAFANNPNLLNVKNDFSVWGTYKSVSGADVPIHMRYAIDKKPTTYTSIQNNITYTSDQWDWRELIYQMALDYFKCRIDEDFKVRLMATNPWTAPTGRTGYEQYYTDMEGFWRQLYNPDPDEEYLEVSVDDLVDDEDKSDIYLSTSYRFITENEKMDIIEGNSDFNVNDLYIIEANTVKDSSGQEKEKFVFAPFIGSPQCCLQTESNGGSKEYYYYNRGILTPTTNMTILNAQQLTNLYEDVEGEKKLIINQRLQTVLKEPTNLLLVKTNEKIRLNDLDESITKVYLNDDKYVDTICRWAVADNYGNLSTEKEVVEPVTYLKATTTSEYDSDTHWNYMVKQHPDQLMFWIDFLDSEGSELFDKYSVGAIGDRTKSINDSNVKSIYYRDVPNIIFVQSLADKTYERQPGYTYIQISPNYQSLFSISGRGKSAKERIDELLQEHSYCIEATTITSVPLYHLEPNTRIAVQDDVSQIQGEYVINKVTVPLTYNGTMSLTANKVVSNIM